MKWKEPELIEWDSENGLTKFESSTGRILMFVPEATSAQNRTTRRHEYLHAVHDRNLPHASGASYWAAQGVADAFVHLVYWPDEWGPNTPEAEDALSEVRQWLPVPLSNTVSEPTVWVVCMLRNLAIAKKLATDYPLYRALALTVLPEKVISRMETILEMVAGGHRIKAERAFDALLTDMAPVAACAA